MSDVNQTVREATAPQEDDQELVTCVLGGVEFGLDINAVQEIVRLPKITRVPRSPAYVEGVANLRGNVLPIVNSRARFGMEAKLDPETNRVVVVELNGQPTGMIVDAVREVMHVHHRDVESAPPAVQSIDGRFLKGVVKLNGGQRLVLLLDHASLLETGALGNEPHKDRSLTGVSESKGQAEGTEEHLEHLVTFRLGEEEYGISIMDVQEIIRVPAISTIPNAPSGVVGIASLRNRILPVLDLRTKFGFRPLKAELEVFSAKVRGFEQQHAQVLQGIEQALEHGIAFDRSCLRVYRDFERWQESFVTSDRLLKSLLLPVRESLKEVASRIRTAVASLESSDRAHTKHLVRSSIQPAHARLESAFEKLHTGIGRRDDERCLVVNVNGTSLALQVDAVNQVLQAPRSTVENTPQIVAGRETSRDQIRGIAKLDDGKRLIMLLAVDKLIKNGEAKAYEELMSQSSMAARETNKAEQEERQLVTFKVANEEFAVDIMQVQEIIRLARVTKVPQVPEFVEGVVNLRGSVLPVIDLRKRVHMECKDYNDSTRVVVVDLKGVKTGIIVDAVSEVLRVNVSNIEPAPSIVRSKYGDHIIEGVGKLNKGERMFLLLRADKLLGADQGKIEALSA